MHELAILLVNYKGADDTIACLDSLAFLADRALVVVVDNASADRLPDCINRHYPWVTLIENDSNLGFTGGNNTGIKLCLERRAKYVWILNNDTTIEENAPANLIRYLEDNSRVGVVSPKIHYFLEPSKVWFSGASLDLRTGTAIHQNNDLVNRRSDEVAWLTGCAMFCRSELLQQTSGFDENYFLNWEDVDLSLRAQNLGWTLAVCRQAIIYHKVSSTLSSYSDISTYYWMRNRLLCTFTHAGRLAAFRATADNFRRAARSFVRESDRGRKLALAWMATRDWSRSRLGRQRW